MTNVLNIFVNKLKLTLINIRFNLQEPCPCSTFCCSLLFHMYNGAAWIKTANLRATYKIEVLQLLKNMSFNFFNYIMRHLKGNLCLDCFKSHFCTFCTYIQVYLTAKIYLSLLQILLTSRIATKKIGLLPKK